MSNDKIIERVKKLLALADSDNENEAKLAMERANDLLLRHNLTSAEVTATRSEITEQAVREDFKMMAVEDKFILSILQKHFFVRALYRSKRNSFWDKSKSQSMFFIGEPLNIEIAAYTYAYLLTSYRHLWLSYKRANQASERSRQAYYIGLTGAIMDKLTLKRQAVVKETGLVVVNDHALSQYMARLGVTKSKAGSRINRDDHAQSAGDQAGRALEIRPGIRTQSQSKASGLYLA